jgi:hypothetical protein
MTFKTPAESACKLFIVYFHRLVCYCLLTGDDLLGSRPTDEWRLMKNPSLLVSKCGKDGALLSSPRYAFIKKSVICTQLIYCSSL